FQGEVAVIVAIEQLVHFAIHANMPAGEDIGGENAFTLQLPPHRHLLCGVHNVIVAVGRLELGAEVACIGNNGLAYTPSLGSDHHYAVHGAGAVQRGGGGVLQDVEAFDIIGVEACNGRAQQGGRITAGQLVV